MIDQRDVGAAIDGFLDVAGCFFALAVMLVVAWVGIVLVAEAWRWLAGIFGM